MINKNFKIKNIIFDLDGTLIDSGPSIIAALQKSFSELDIKPISIITTDLIGPPLIEIISKLIPKSKINSVQSIVEGFKSHYDEKFCIEANIYDGVSELLIFLKNKNIKIYIATNKRMKPTVKIIQHLEWGVIFDDIYTIDSNVTLFQNKSMMLDHLKSNLSLSSNDSLYIGDRYEDAEAAFKVGLPFMMAKWGYSGEKNLQLNIKGIECPFELKNFIKKLC
jgi:phosphoglycolate phosphatase